MTLVVDAGPLIALFGTGDPQRGDPQRGDALRTLLAEPDELVVPAPVTAEVDHLLGRWYGERSRRDFLGDLAADRFEVPHLDRDDYATIAQLNERYADLRLGLADASLVVLAHRYDTDRILTFDERHFRAVSRLDGTPFRLLPADE